MDSQEPTQLTQQILDPRRVGRDGSGLGDDDAADVLLLLSAVTPAATHVIECTAERGAHHVIFNNSMVSRAPDISNIEEQETIIIDQDVQRQRRPSRGTPDLALRLSSVSLLKAKNLGFVFGRNPATSDIVFVQDSGRRISNQHFRIFLNDAGLPMLEDMSTNGTLVDSIPLKSKDARFHKARMLSHGAEIAIANSNAHEVVRFNVRFPSRSSPSHRERFEANKRAFMAECTVGEDRERALQRIAQRTHQAKMKWDGGEKYHIIGELGKGAFATVYQLGTRMDGKVWAAKELEKRKFMKNGQLDKKIDNEMKIMARLRHKNIIEFVEYHDQGDYLYLIMEYAQYGDLQKYLGTYGPLREDKGKELARQMLEALNYLHRERITHRDIKPDNILISELDPFQVKISDFGLSKMVHHEETFLKTFCGTLLYCAPEVFPDFNGQGTKRRRGASKKSTQYSSSVDIWSFGGVLWFALCGEPPFKGIADSTGQAMYTNIMTTRLDPTPLRKRGISEECIDLLSRMLQTEPENRPTEIEALNHPWLKTGASIVDDAALHSIVEEDESGAEEQLSQLRIGSAGHTRHNGTGIEEEDDDVLSDVEFENMLDYRKSKRIRQDRLFPRNQIRDYEDNSSVDASFQSAQARENPMEFDDSFQPIGQTGKPRLFGEIGKSALQSSGILSEHANQALSNTASTKSGGRSENQGVAEDGSRRRTPSATRDLSKDHGLPISSSLLGAESLVRDLNMASPPSQDSGQYSPNEPATPKTPDVVQLNSLEHSHKDPSQSSEPTPRARPLGFNRQISLPKTPSLYWDPYDPKTHTVEYASEVSGLEFSAELRNITARKGSVADTINQSGNEGNDDVNAAPHRASSVAIPELPAELDIKPPPRRLGKLIATPDSFVPSLVLNIDRSKTSWGRAPHNTIVYEDTADTRIPKTAFVIFWWSSSGNLQESVEKLSQSGEDWTSLEDLHVSIMTCARQGIWVNDTHLLQSDASGRPIYGHLHSGDIIHVYTNQRNRQYLKFKCEFYLGSGKEPRAAGGSFKKLFYS